MWRLSLSLGLLERELWKHRTHRKDFSGHDYRRFAVALP